MRFIPKLSSYPNFLPNRGTENAPKNCENEHTSRILDWNFLPCTFIWKIAQTSVRFITAHPESNIFHLENSTFHLENNAFHLENSTFNLENNTFHLENSTFHLKNNTFHLENSTLSFKQQQNINFSETSFIWKTAFHLKNSLSSRK